MTAMAEIRLDRRTEATVRHLRTLLDEARDVIRASPDNACMLLLDLRISEALHEAEQLAPNLYR
ncbi:MAG: hypothetical protein JSS05_14860 [Proteobacteria bacterium]|nr:hypothetical protein [Pseudomonadota bacterium]